MLIIKKIKKNKLRQEKYFLKEFLKTIYNNIFMINFLYSNII